jgi:hexokinase
MEKTNKGLTPVYESDIEKHKKLKIGMYKVRVTRPRNLKHHRKFFAILRLVLDNTSKWYNEKELLTAIKFSMGYTINIKTFDNVSLIEVPKSINFETMNQSDFENFYNAALKILAVEIGTTPDEIENNHEKYL